MGNRRIVPVSIFLFRFEPTALKRTGAKPEKTERGKENSCIGSTYQLLVADTDTIVNRDFLPHFPPMQLSIKTPPEMTLPILEKCAVLAERVPSSFAMTCAWQCLKWMGLPHARFYPLEMVIKYYHASGRELEILPRSKEEDDSLIRQLTDQNRAKRAKEAAKRRTEFRAQVKRQPPSKHLHLKISEGIDELPKRIKEKATWLRISPNALVVACLRDCLEAMDDPKKALVPPPIVVDFWAVSHTQSRRKSTSAIDSMVMKSLEGVMRERSVPILDTIVRLALSEQWDASLEQILRDADVITEKREYKR
jgi:hypothetical protein